MKERDCKNCIHANWKSENDNGCTQWECNYKPNTYEQGFNDGYFQALKQALERLRKVTGE